ncbi:MAG TPA: hypothetical protein VJI13_01045 [Candidatus Norongarragalinales archaeon]|nr:hypothetical protein [Candidatus Norongarragalinales archaeon]
MVKKGHYFSDHYHKEREQNVGKELVIDCIHHGRKELESYPNKFKNRKLFNKGELIVIYLEFDDYFYIITAFWNVRGR